MEVFLSSFYTTFNSIKELKMNIEFRFLQKAIVDKNYITFTYEDKSYKNVKALKIDEQNKVHSDKGIFEFEKISKLKILKDKF
jgi:hypothetical protein